MPELAARVLSRLASLDRMATPDRPTIALSAFQAEAVRRGWRTVRDRGGVIIADPVGVGKSYIAAGLVDAAVRNGVRTILVTAPAAICRDWHRLLDPLARGHSFSIARGPRAADALRADSASSGRLAILSHTSIGLGSWPDWLDSPDLLVCDEAHAFRNPSTRRYAGLSRLCRRGQVVLLTATPINNSLLDLYFIMRLFLVDHALADLGVPSLRDAFRSERSASRGEVSLVGRAVSAIMIRRTRSQIERCQSVGGPRFPIRSPPIPVRWEIPAAPEILGTIAGLHLAPLGLTLPAHTRLDGDRSRGPGRSELMRYVLLKRLESGLATFAASLDRLIYYLLAFRSALRAGYFLPASLHRANRISRQLSFETLLLEPLPRGLTVDRVAEHTDADIDALIAVRQILGTVMDQGDPKLAALRKLLGGPVAGRKAILFSEYRDTAASLFTRLGGAGGVGLIHGGRALTASGPMPRLDLVRRFAPIANLAATPPARERVDLLIATDVLAEGLNLQDAEVVISYDLPWNPVRLVQRLGRIDRMGSPHDRVMSYNFLPDRNLEEFLGLLARIRRKLATIRAGMAGSTPAPPRAGVLANALADPAIPSMDPPVAEVVRRVRSRDPLLFDDIERASSPVDRLSDRLHRAIDSVAQDPSDRDGVASPTILVASAGVARARKQPVTPRPEAAWGILALCGHRPAWLVVDDRGEVSEARDPVLEALLDAADACTLDHAQPTVSRPGDDIRIGPRAKSAEAESVASAPVEPGGVDRASAREAMDAGLRYLHQPPNPVMATGLRAPLEQRVVRSLMSALDAIPGGPDFATCARADAVLASLRTGVRHGVVAQIAEIGRAARTAVRAAPGSSSRQTGASAIGTAAIARASTLLDRLESALGAAGSGAEPGTGERPVVIALIRLHANPGRETISRPG
ncbi:MAG: SNF2-related protein [Gemmatimonadetes bacterium]|nr:SNF2-related protein [Gemmatimonadota bacterium]